VSAIGTKSGLASGGLALLSLVAAHDAAAQAQLSARLTGAQ